MDTFDVGTLLQLGPLAVVLIYIVVRLERAMGSIALAMGQMTHILLLLLRHAGLTDEEALALCEGKQPWPPARTGGQ